MADSTLLTEFVDDVRNLLGDVDADVHLYDTDQITSAMGTVVRCGKVPGWALDSGKTSVVPALDPANGTAQVKAFAQLIFNTAKMFIVQATDYHVAIRSFKRSSKRPGYQIDAILTELEDMEPHSHSGQTRTVFVPDLVPQPPGAWYGR